MQTLNKAELAFLAILADSGLAVKAIQLYSKNIYLFDETFCPHLARMWTAFMSVLSANKKEHGLDPGKDIIAAGLIEALQADRSMPPELLERCDGILQRLVSGDVPSEADGSAALQQVCKRAMNRKIGAQLTMNAGIAELEKTLETSKQAISTFDTATQTDNLDDAVFNPFNDIAKLATYAPRIPTGINWLDAVTSGGGRQGELWLILGSSGGGKSVCAVQYACAQALMGNITMWATYEQPIAGDLAERIIACVTDVSLDRIRDRGFENLDQSIQDKFWASVAGANEKLKAVDITKLKPNFSEDSRDNGGMYTIWKKFKQFKEQGQKPKTVIVDWIGAMMSTVAALSGKDLTNGYRFHLQAEIDIARQMAKEEGIQIIFFHQTDSKSQHARPVYIPDKTCAKDAKDMAHYMDIVLTLGIRDPHDVCWISAAKSRKGAPITKTIQLIGDKSRFIQADGWLPNRDGNFYKPGGEDDLTEEQEQEKGVKPFSREID